MTEAQFQVLRAAGFVLAAGVALALQRWTPHARRRGSWQVNGALWAVNLAVMGTVCGACACTVARWAEVTNVGLLHATRAPTWVALPLTVVALDLVSYAWHRANHVVPGLWRFHRVHHADPSFTVSTGVRFHPGELVLSLPPRLAAIAALGAPVPAVVAFEVAFAVANLVEHGDIDLPARLERRLGAVFVTPALHRRHHGRRGALRGTNFGTVFTLWDRLLGTYGPSASAWRLATGLPGTAGRPGLIAALVLPFAPARPPHQR